MAARATMTSNTKLPPPKKKEREDQNSRVFQDELRHSPNLSCQSYGWRDASRDAWKMAGRWSKSYSPWVRKPVGWPVNNQPGVIIINHGVIPPAIFSLQTFLSEELGRYESRPAREEQAIRQRHDCLSWHQSRLEATSHHQRVWHACQRW